MSELPRVLLIGYGNPGRLDDGLGPALAARVEALNLPHVTVDADYQLTVEHAAEVAAYDVVIFVDAATSGPEPLRFTPLAPMATTAVTFSSHSVSPAGVLGLAAELFGARPAAYVLAICGYEFNEFGERLSPAARANLDAALSFVTPLLNSGEFDKACADAAASPAPAAHGDTLCKTASL